MRHAQREKVSLEELTAGKLPEKIRAAIIGMEMTVEEMLKWDAGKAALRIRVAEGDLIIEMRARVPVKKALAILASVAGVLWALTNFAIRHWPTIQGLFDRA